MNEMPEEPSGMPLAPASIVYTPQGSFWAANEYAQIKEWMDDETTSMSDHIALVGLESTQADQSMLRTYDLSLMRAYIVGLRSFSQEAFEEQFGPQQPAAGAVGGLALLLGGGGLAAMHTGQPVPAKEVKLEDECCCTHSAEHHRMPQDINDPVGECLDKECGCGYFHRPHGKDRSGSQ